ncbi:uncharacterized protein Tco025E_07929 [Trypanosoma conorhini]|uniref:Pre-rRNA-processing protein Ipi1 N-terminal domain-containing protein n=1 Tax=Trypanosoma conorhini TaxID=83891 RepID=A0A3R7L057_9TRYP|nr:uncharacterized protein Tco025E_07929 [Trypanosoma conorhini]RNF04904.1 hypothetical protein Tco025E_07929 [Trypanosoma conorhini]
MVRVKAKARKGDDAFQTRRQKVGRKKLAPATATRAEVHARTLRVTTPAAISRTTLEEGVRGRQRHDEQQPQPVAVSAEKLHRDFKEQLSNTRHYKKSFRGAGFMSLVRAITANYEALRAAAAARASSAAAADRCAGALLSPIEVLSAFTSALDAMSDTDGDVRRAALATLKAILLPPSPGGHGAEEDDDDGATPWRRSTPASDGAACDADRTRAVLRVVDVTLTHAMTSVRRSGVELLHLVLQAAPHDVRVVLRESDAWVKMVGRVSAVLLHGTSGSSAGANTTRLIHVVPDMLETMLQQWEGGGEGLDVGLCGTQQAEQGEEATGAAPQRILELFEECTPKWGMEWKELMEMRAAIFRDAERVQRATAIARAFACLAMYLRSQSLLRKPHTQLLRHLFTVKMPFTMQELTLAAAAAEHGGGHGRGRARMALANAIADACLPVADAASEACQLLRDFLSAALRPAKGVPPSSSGRHPCGGGENGTATQLLGPLRTLRTAFVRFSAGLLPRLLFLAPPMMQAAIRAVGGADGGPWGDAALLTADVLAVLLASQAAAAARQGLRFLAEAVLAVPRLLFALRGKADTATVDRVAAAFLRPLWSLASGGHPLLQTRTASGGDDAAAQLRLSLPSLFELRVPDAAAPGATVALDGVLPRCTEPTRELGAHLLFYLCGGAPCAAAAPPLALTALACTLPRC